MIRQGMIRKQKCGLGLFLGLGILAGAASPAWAESAPAEAESALHRQRGEQLMWSRVELNSALQHISDLRQSLGQQPTAASTAPALGSAPATPPALDVHEWLRRVNVWPTMSRRRRGLLIAGAITFGAGWLISIAYSALSGRAAGTYRTADYSMYWPGFVPVAGPWIELGYHLEIVSVFSGLAQAAGCSVLIAGVLSRKTVPVPRKSDIAIAPLLTAPGSFGIAVLGRFK